MSDVKGKRPYRSTLREAGARQTRQAIVAAASELFLDQGYTATSLSGIATRAGVARPTPHAVFGSKSAILRAVVDQALAGDDEPIPVADRPWFQPVWQATDQLGVFTAYAKVCTLIGARAARIFDTVRQAADDSAETAQLWQQVQDNRLAGARMVCRRAADLGPLACELDRAVDVIWVLNDPCLYGDLVHRRQWSEAAYTAWLATHMGTVVPAPHG
ncbi:TetR/AcrR family transcriptional regulator [Labedaea rhizosphaerae]|uniref:TetR family transcriptional regulator n=1 Tax=Labedaea rhizosphaerae TaxID=598644 RepID=A0A4V3D0E9_LABRH|nr:TetR/AcrR family transcriptional regulator [Labedaea rhizosphaerae]TDQ05555.1 TetR family transcriptional regulator [Labedaea rhizosphaerae]